MKLFASLKPHLLGFVVGFYVFGLLFLLAYFANSGHQCRSTECCRVPYVGPGKAPGVGR